jgi:hypothetical protein
MVVSPQVQRTKTRPDALGISAATLCVLGGVSPSQFSNALRGIKPLDGQAEFRLATMSLRLTELSESVAPLKIPGDAVTLSRLLSYMEAHQVSSEQIRSSVLSLFGHNSGGSQS